MEREQRSPIGKAVEEVMGFLHPIANQPQVPEISIPSYSDEDIQFVAGALGEKFDFLMAKALGATKEFIRRRKEAGITTGSPLLQQYEITFRVLSDRREQEAVEANFFAGLSATTIGELDRLDAVFRVFDLFIDRMDKGSAKGLLEEFEYAQGLKERKDPLLLKLLRKIGLGKNLEQIYSQVSGKEEIRAKTIQAIEASKSSLMARTLVQAVGAMLDNIIACKYQVERYDGEIFKYVRRLRGLGENTKIAISEEREVLQEYWKTEEEVENSKIGRADVLDNTPILSDKSLTDKIRKFNGEEIDEEEIDKYVGGITTLYNLNEDVQRAVNESLRLKLKTASTGTRIRNLITRRNMVGDYEREGIKHLSFVVLLYSELKHLTLQALNEVALTKDAVARRDIIERVETIAQKLAETPIEEMQIRD